MEFTAKKMYITHPALSEFLFFLKIIVVREKIIEEDFRRENEFLNDEMNFYSVN